MTKRSAKISETDIATLAATVKAPESLHRRVQEMVTDAQTPAPAKRRLRWTTPRWTTMPVRRLAAVAASMTALVAVVALVLAVMLTGGGGSSALTPQTAAALALAAATAPAPHESPGDRHELAASVGGVAFPYWKDRFGWRGSGARTDELGGRSVTTVFYSDARGQRIGYAIASGRAPAILGGEAIRRWGVTYQLSMIHGAHAIAWQRAGHLCVIAGRGVSTGVLISLASWEDGSRAV